MIQDTPTFRRHSNTFGNRPHVRQQHPAVRQSSVPTDQPDASTHGLVVSGHVAHRNRRH